MCLFKLIIIFHMAIYVVFSLTGISPVLHWEVSFKGWLLVNAGISPLHNVMWFLKGAVQSLLERGALAGWMGVPASSTRVFCPPEEQKICFLIRDFLGILKCYFFISRWFSLLGGAAASLTNAWAYHTTAGGFVLLTQSSCSGICKAAGGNWQCWALHETRSEPSRTEPKIMVWI